MGPAQLAETGRAHAELAIQQLVETQRRAGRQDERLAEVQQAGGDEIPHGTLDGVAGGEALILGTECTVQLVQGEGAGVEGEHLLQHGRLRRRIFLFGADQVPVSHDCIVKGIVSRSLPPAACFSLPGPRFAAPCAPSEP